MSELFGAFLFAKQIYKIDFPSLAHLCVSQFLSRFSPSRMFEVCSVVQRVRFDSANLRANTRKKCAGDVWKIFEHWKSGKQFVCGVICFMRWILSIGCMHMTFSISMLTELGVKVWHTLSPSNRFVFFLVTSQIQATRIAKKNSFSYFHAISSRWSRLSHIAHRPPTQQSSSTRE